MDINTLEHRFKPGERVWVIGTVEQEKGEGKVPWEVFVLCINYSSIPENYVEYQLGRKDPSSDTGFKCLLVLEDTETSKADIFLTKEEALNSVYED